mgnify:CR=1 FL=1
MTVVIEHDRSSSTGLGQPCLPEVLPAQALVTGQGLGPVTCPVAEQQFVKSVLGMEELAGDTRRVLALNENSGAFISDPQKFEEGGKPLGLRIWEFFDLDEN